MSSADADRYRVAQAETLLRQLLVRGSDGKWHAAYVRQPDGTYAPSEDFKQAGPSPELRMPPTQGGKIIPSTEATRGRNPHE